MFVFSSSSSSPLVSGTDYIYMNSSVYRNGTSFVESLFETFGEFPHSDMKCTTTSEVLLLTYENKLICFFI